MQVTEYQWTRRETVNVERHCSNCGSSWVACFKIEVSGTGATKKDAKREARDKLDTAVAAAKRNECEQVLCTSCDHFADTAMKKYYRKGYAVGMCRQFRGAAWADFYKAIAALVFALVLVGFIKFFALSDEFGDDVWGPACAVVFGIIAIAAVGFSVYKMTAWAGLLMQYRRVARMIRDCEEEKLLPLAVECYKAAGGTLEPNKTWADTLLSHTH
ncbi:MAG: hypothetical protein ACYS3N_19115 [Planctomycetota bacterium]|jgi:hypothetical protein